MALSSNSSQDQHPATVQGILYIDKPTGLSSHTIVNIIRRKTGVKRVGHTGTLDPLATGLLIILVGRNYTKLQDAFLKQDKEYEVTIELGKETDTYDITGNIVAEADPQVVESITKDQVLASLAQFRGTISQTVPAYSAVKIKGKKLYESARRNKLDLSVLPSRMVTIHELELLEFAKQDVGVSIKLRVACSSGTYIRSLAADLGKVLGVGGTVTSLRRTKIGSLSVNDAQSPDEEELTFHTSP